MIDFSRYVSAPSATMLLADLGAEVIKVEPTEHIQRHSTVGPFVDGIGMHYYCWVLGKKCIGINLRSEKGRGLVKELIGQFDVLVENFTPGTMDKMGLGYSVLSQLNPRLIYASCSGFGRTGPYRSRGGVDLIAQALSGLMYVNSDSDTPREVGLPIADLTAGLYLTIAILAALREREASGLGQLVEVSLLQSVLAILNEQIVAFSVERSSRPKGTPQLMPYQMFRAKDGFLVIAFLKDWQLFCSLLGLDELAMDPRFQENDGRVAHCQELESKLQAVFADKTVKEVMSTLAQACLVAPVQTLSDALEDPHVRARGDLVSVQVPASTPRSIQVPRPPVRMSRSKVSIGGPGPLHGQDTDWVLSTLAGKSPGEIEALRAEGVVD